MGSDGLVLVYILGVCCLLCALSSAVFELHDGWVVAMLDICFVPKDLSMRRPHCIHNGSHRSALPGLLA